MAFQPFSLRQFLGLFFLGRAIVRLLFLFELFDPLNDERPDFCRKTHFLPPDIFRPHFFNAVSDIVYIEGEAVGFSGHDRSKLEVPLLYRFKDDPR
jgi:hypothetical protein